MTVQLINREPRNYCVANRRLRMFAVLTTMALLSLPTVTVAQTDQTEKKNHEHCVPAVNFTGDDQAIHEVQEELEQLNLSTLQKKDCPAFHVELNRQENGYHFIVTAPQTPAYERTVKHAETVAVLLDAFVLRVHQTPSKDEEAPSESPSSDATSHSEPAKPKTHIVQAAMEKSFPAEHRSLWRGPVFEVILFPEITVAFDRSVWFGGDFVGCVRFGKLCIGPNMRFAIDTLDAGKTRDSALHRNLLNVTLTANFNLWRGPFVLVPGIGLGGGWTFVEERDQPDDVHHVHSGFRVDAYLQGTANLNERWSIEIGVSTGVSVPAETSVSSSDGIDISEPRGVFRVGFGASYRFGGGVDFERGGTAGGNS